jgi:superfamily II DNA or RNA helicase
MRTKDQLRDYQNRTVDKLYESDGVELVLPMGSGKTAAALTTIEELIRDG